MSGKERLCEVCRKRSAIFGDELCLNCICDMLDDMEKSLYIPIKVVPQKWKCPKCGQNVIYSNVCLRCGYKY